MYRYLTLSMLLFVACAESTNETNNQEPRAVKSIVAANSEVVEKLFAGLSTPEMEVNLAFKVAGQIINIPIANGELVYSGTTLARIDPRDLELTVAADKASYEQAKSSYDRATRLLMREAISRQEAESAESTYARSESAYKNSLELLEQTSLKAPFTAVVERIYVQEYQRVQAGETIMRVVSPTTNRVSFTLPEGSLSAIKDDKTRFSVTFDNYPGEHFDAEILEYARSSSDASGFPVTLTIHNPAPDIFYINSGLSCSVTMSTPERDIGAVVLPLSAIYAPISGGTFVWIIDSANRVKLVPVELGAPVGQQSIVVTNGVVGGEDIVVAGVYQLYNNQEVKIIK